MRDLIIINFLLLFLAACEGGGGGGGNSVDDFLGIDNSSESDPLAGTIGNSAFSFSQTSKQFPTTSVDSASSAISITVENISTVQLYIGDVSLGDNTHFSIDSTNCYSNGPLSIIPGEQCNIDLVFNPKLPGNHTGEIVLKYGLSSSQSTKYSTSEAYSGLAASSINFSGITGADTVTHKSAIVYWTPNTGALSYHVYYGTGAGEAFLGTSSNPLDSQLTVNLQPSTTYALRVRAVDLLGGIDTNTEEISITTSANLPPVLTAITDLTTYSGRAAAARDATDLNSGADVDQQADTLTYTCRYDNTIDGVVLATANNCSSLSNEGGGYASFDTSTGILSGWVPRNLDRGQSYEFEIIASDGYGGSDSDIFVTTVGAGVDIATALSNATIAEDSNHLIVFTISDSNLNADCNGTYLSMSSTNTALVPNANVVWGGSYPNCTATISPVADGFGSADLTITLAEGLAIDTETFTLTVNNANDAPTLTSIANQSTSEDTSVQITYSDLVAAADEADVDGDVLSFKIMSLNSGSLSYSGGAITYGTTTIGIGEWIDWTPPANQNDVTNGAAFNAIEFRVDDGTTDNGSNVALSVNVSAINDIPTMTSIANFTTDEDTDLVITYADLIASADEADVEGSTILFRVMGLSTGALTYSGGAIVYGTTTVGVGETLTWTPPTNENNVTNGGNFSVLTLKAFDGTDESASSVPLTSTVNAINDPPVQNTIVDQIVEANQAVTAIDAYDSNSGNDTDADGQTLTYTCYYDTSVDAAVANVSLCSSLTNLSFVGATGAFTWTPDSILSGNYEFKITASDGSLTDAEIFVINVTPDVTPPSTPFGLSISSPASTPNSDTTPTVSVSGLVVGDTLTLHSDSNCLSGALGTKAVVATTDTLDTAALNEGIYTIYALAQDPAGNSSACSVSSASYHVETGNPAAVTVVYPGLQGTNDPTQSAVFSWAASTSTDVDHYEVSLGTTIGGNEVAGFSNIGGLLTHQFTGLPALASCTDYYPSVRVHDLLGNTSLDTAAAFRFDNVNPQDPSIVGLSDLATDQQSQTLTWNPAGTLDDCLFSHYEVALGTSAGAQDVVAWTNVGSSTSYQFTGLAAQTLAPSTDYYISLRAVDAAGNYSSTLSSSAWQVECWQDSYTYCRKITLSSVTETSEQPVPIDLNLVNFDYSHVNVNGDDIRFYVPGSTTALPYWLERWNTAGDSTVWTQVPSSGTTTIEIRYGAALVNSEDKSAVFSYSTEKDLYVSSTTLGTMQFISYSAGNTYTFSTDTNQAIGQYVMQTVANNPGLITAKSGLEGRVLDDNPNYDTIVPMSFAGRELAYGSTRSYNDFYRLYNPNPTAATVTISEYNSSGTLTGTSSFTLNAGVSTTYNAVGPQTVIVDSTIPIVGSVDSGSYDALPLLPAQMELIGIPSNGGFVTFVEDGTTATIYKSSTGTSQTVSGDKGERVKFESGGGGAGNAYGARIVANKPIIGNAQADGDGTDSVAFYPLSLLDDEYLIPTDYEYITIACPYTMTVTIYNSSGTVVDTGICTAPNALRPGQYYYNPPGATGGAGARVVASEVFYLYYEYETQDETNVVGLKAARPYVVNQPTAGLGSEP